MDPSFTEFSNSINDLCGVKCLKEEMKEIEDRHPQRFYDCVDSFNPSSSSVLAATPK